MGKPTICIGENKDADQLRGNREADQRLCFRYWDLFYFSPKFQASSSFLCLYRPVCVGPVRKPHCWFSHEAAQMCYSLSLFEYWTHSKAVQQYPFLAHLSRRWPCSVVRPQFQISSLKPLGQPKPNFMWSILRMGEPNFI